MCLLIMLKQEKGEELETQIWKSIVILVKKMKAFSNTCSIMTYQRNFYTTISLHLLRNLFVSIFYHRLHSRLRIADRYWLKRASVLNITLADAQQEAHEFKANVA